MEALYAAFNQLDSGTPLAIAFSGGRDSTPLLHAAAACIPINRLRALHVQHDMCDQAADWAAHCRSEAAALGVECKVLPVQTGAYAADGPEGAARRARYRALATELGCGEWLATAHHALDQAETFLLQALRGAGVAGLAAMPEFMPLGAGWLWRPWRDLDRETIVTYTKECGLACLSDPANLDQSLARGRLRTTVWPVLADAFPASGRTLARSAQLAGEAAEAVVVLAEQDLATARMDSYQLSIAALRPLSPARRAAVLRHWLAGLALDAPGSAHVEQFERLLNARAHGGPRLGFGDTELRVFSGAVYAMPRLAIPPAGLFEWSALAPIDLPADAGWLRLISGVAPVQPLTVDFCRGGERLVQRNGRSKRLSAWFYDQGWPPWLRERTPLIYAAGQLIAVADAWQHPDIEYWLGADHNGFEWQHALVGDPRYIADSAVIR